jgi:hypothetical protein
VGVRPRASGLLLMIIPNEFVRCPSGRRFPALPRHRLPEILVRRR